MRKIIMLTILITLFTGCKKETPVMHEGLFQYRQADKNLCLFISVPAGEEVQLSCPDQVKLQAGEVAYVVYSTTSKGTKLESVSDPLSMEHAQATWGDGCDFYFPMEDLWREMLCTDTQQSRLSSMGKMPLSLGYYKYEDNYYLIDMEKYNSEFTELMYYTGDERTHMCGFYNTKLEVDMALSCTRSQRAALEKYHVEAPLQVTYTDAGGYRLIDFQAPEQPVAGSHGGNDEYTDYDDYEMSFEVLGAVGSFIAKDSSPELCVFSTSRTTLKLSCAEHDYEFLSNNPGRYEIYYTSGNALFGYDKAN